MAGEPEVGVEVVLSLVDDEGELVGPGVAFFCDVADFLSGRDILSDLDSDVGDVFVDGEVFAVSDNDEFCAVEVFDGGDGSFEDGFHFGVGVGEQFDADVVNHDGGGVWVWVFAEVLDFGACAHRPGQFPLVAGEAAAQLFFFRREGDGGGFSPRA